MKDKKQKTIATILIVSFLLILFLGVFFQKLIIAIIGLLIVNIVARILFNKYPFFGTER